MSERRAYDPDDDRDRVLLAACAYAKDNNRGPLCRHDGSPSTRGFASGFGLVQWYRVYVVGGDIMRLRRMVREGLVVKEGYDYDPVYEITTKGRACLSETTRPIKRRKPARREHKQP